MEKPEMRMVLLSKEFGWTLTQMLDEPAWFINEMMAYMTARGNYEKNQSNKK